ncbi:MAG: AAA family ATPase [Planctomycetota bacterium]
MYLDYWKLKKNPFNNVPDPDMYFEMHKGVEAAVSEVMFAVEEGDDCLAVVVGKVGVGKTMCLRMVLDALDKTKYRIAFVTNPDLSFGQLLREIIGQLLGTPSEEKRKDRLLEQFNRILFETSDAGRRVLVFIDEGNAMRPSNLESLRLLTNMQDDHQNLFTMILAGQPELARKLEDPRRANLFQRIGVYCRIPGIESREILKDYVEHRLERAGLTPGRTVFTEDAFDALWTLSEGGVPRLINKMCKLALKAGETNNLSTISGEVVAAVGERFARMKRTAKAPRIVTAPEPAARETEETPVSEAPEASPTPVMETPAPESVVSSTSPRFETAPTPAAGPISRLPTGAPEEPLPTPVLPETKPNGHEEDKNVQKIASRLATERIKAMMPELKDPYQTWVMTRKEILSGLLPKK